LPFAVSACRDSLHGSSGALRVEDVLVLLSKSGETKETLELRRLFSGEGRANCYG
jgi:D-arabinose 5-phosphate isomerase GutQ